MRTVNLSDGGVNHPALVFLAQRVLRSEDDSNGHQVIHVLEGALLAHHLLPYRIDGLDTRFDSEGITHTRQPFADRPCELLVGLHLRTFDEFHFVVYLLPRLRMFVFETQVFQFRLDREQT